MQTDHPAPWIVVPAYQAAATLGSVLDRIPRTLVDGGARILVVDDGSHDETSAVARSHDAEVLRNDRNLGYGATQKRGISHAQGRGATSVVILHADGQYPPESLPLRNESRYVPPTSIYKPCTERNRAPSLPDVPLNIHECHKT